ncbi:hypothetical protein AJ79_10225 [Helicocarpus griseus UAMH5409]|uniref:Uncharacterized protein n=1 Tax=Helicocarpus griseus UAMH5409 TaxID=1447875 RepID=A0A2B7WF65_9EURO|nr:hypothetical protein AJ79_10225 [Helicocarpus griseus UAMH5409]
MPPLSKPVAGPRVIQVEGLTAEDVTLRPIIKYCDKTKRHVQSSSFHGLWYVGELEIWTGFENEVRKNFAGIEWKDHPTILAYEPGEDVSKLHLHAGDHFICGEELSISGRWVQHVLHPMSAVGKEPKYNMVFGDWKATAECDVNFVQSGKYDRESGKIIPLDETVAAGDTMKQRKRKNLIPDYALMVEENGAPRAVGEAKTPWNHDFQALWIDIQNTNNKLLMRRALGQIGNYMIELQLKYGFLTNFDQTFFLKREIINVQETLYCSPPVKYNASPLYGDEISLRQSLLLLQSSVVGNDSVWTTEKTSEAGIIRKKKSEKMEDAKRRVGDAVQGLSSSMDNMSHEFGGLSVEGGERRARFDINPVSDPPSRSSTLPRRR